MYNINEVFMKSAAVFFADGFEDVEALCPVDYLRRAGINVLTVGVKGKNEGKLFITTSSHNVPIVMDMSIEEYFNNYSSIVDCVICPGGSVGAENLANNKKLLAHLQDSWNNGKIVAAICASPAVVLGKTEILKERKWTCYPDMESHAKSEFLSGYKNKTFIEDGNLITARGPGASEEFAMQIVKKMCGEEVFAKIRKGTQQTPHSDKAF